VLEDPRLLPFAEFHSITQSPGLLGRLGSKKTHIERLRQCSICDLIAQPHQQILIERGVKIGLTGRRMFCTTERYCCSLMKPSKGENALYAIEK